ncbi:MAG: MaoC family dehydratase [Bacteroidales bacterium]|nr:MaoC family dehydratase [Bacteroidales bacterium]
MSQLVISSLKEFSEYIGKEIGVSNYISITQDQINMFAEATIDHQWIHTDPERAKKESPFKNTIAHGYLTLSLLPHLWQELVEFKNVKLMVNYGIEKLKFNQPVVVNSRVRIRVNLLSLLDLRGVTKAQMKVVMEIEGNKKPAFDATIVFLYHFKSERL